MTVGRRLLVDGAAELEVADDRTGAQIEDLPYRALDRSDGHLLGAEGVDHDGERVRNADGICELHLATMGEACCHDVFRHPARRVGGRAVHFGAILAAERSASMSAHAAVGVDDDLAPGQAGVAHGTTHHEAPRWVHVNLGALPSDARSLHDGRDHMLKHISLDDRHVIDLGSMLGGDDDGLDGDGAIILVAHRDLRLAIGAEVGHRAVVAHLG